MPSNQTPKPLYSKPNQQSLPYKEPLSKGLNLSPKPRQPLNLQYKQPSAKTSSSFRPESFGKDVNSNAYKDYNQNINNQNLRTRKLINGRRTSFSEIPKGNNAVKAAPLAIKGSGIAAKTKSVALGTVKLGVASVSLWTLAIYGTVEGIFTRRAGITDEERERAISQYYPGKETKLAEGVVPFEGGQIAGAGYIAECNWHSPRYGNFGIGGRVVYGPITRVECSTEPRDQFNYYHKIEVYHHDNDGNPTSFDFRYRRPYVEDIDIRNYWITVEPYGHDGTGDSNLPAVGEVVSPRVAPQPQPPFPADETIVDDSPIASSNKPIPQPSKQTDPTPPPEDSNEDIQAIKAKLDDIEKRLIDANPGGKEGKSDSAIADKEKADSLEQTVTKQKINQTNINNGLDLDISNPVVDIPTVNPTNIIKPIVRTQKYSVNQLDKLKRQRRVEQIELQRDADKAERQQKIDKLNNQIDNSSGAKILPPPNIDPEKQIDITDGSQTGKDIQPKTETELKQTPKESDAELLGKIGALFTATPLLNKDGFKEAVEEAVCDSSQGGCLKSNLVDPLQNGQNNLTKVLQGFDFGLLIDINAKLGEAIPGGLSGFLTKAWQSTQIDKMLNLINTTLLIHNASMLSQNIAQTVGDVISNGLEAIGVKDAEGQAINFNEAIGSTITNLITSVVGAENYTNLSTNWTKANRIYQTGVNVLSNVRSIVDATQDIAETAGENVSLIGNALKKSGVVRENSYPWMPEDLNTQSRWLNRLDKIQDSVEIFEDITDNARDISEELKDMKEKAEAFKEEIEEKTKKKLEKEDKNKTTALKIPTLKEEDEDRFTEEDDE